MTAKDVGRHLRKNIGGNISYSTLNRYVKKYFGCKAFTVTVHVELKCTCGSPNVFADLGWKVGRMIKIDEWLAVRILRSKGISIKKIVKLCGISRNTVRRVIKEDQWRVGKRPPKMHHVFGLIDYCNQDVKSAHKKNDLIAENKLWMHRLLHGKIKCGELKRQFASKISFEHIKPLYDCVLRKPLKTRNQAITILSYFKGISKRVISDYLLISRSTIRHYLEQYNSGGITKLLTKRRGELKKYEDPIYKKEIFSILHSPPSHFGFNRSTWRQNDIREVMEMKAFKISKNYIAKIIKNAGY